MIVDPTLPSTERAPGLLKLPDPARRGATCFHLRSQYSYIIIYNSFFPGYHYLPGIYLSTGSKKNPKSSRWFTILLVKDNSSRMGSFIDFPGWESHEDAGNAEDTKFIGQQLAALFSSFETQKSNALTNRKLDFVQLLHVLLQDSEMIINIQAIASNTKNLIQPMTDFRNKLEFYCKVEKQSKIKITRTPCGTGTQTNNNQKNEVGSSNSDHRLEVPQVHPLELTYSLINTSKDPIRHVSIDENFSLTCSPIQFNKLCETVKSSTPEISMEMNKTVHKHFSCRSTNLTDLYHIDVPDEIF